MKIFLLLSIASAVSGIQILCQFQLANWVKIGETSYCVVDSMNFTDNPTTVTSVNGYNGSLGPDVKMIMFPSFSCPNFNLKTVPKGLLNFFPNLLSIHFYNCSIDALRGDELVEYPNLVVFKVWGMNLNKIPGNLFDATPNLKYVGFINSKLEHVGFNLLSNLRNLETVDFSQNTCINTYAGVALEVPPLINALRLNCPEDEATTTIKTTSTSLAPSGNCDDYINQIVELTTKLGDQAVILQQKEVELAEAKQENLNLKATC